MNIERLESIDCGVSEPTTEELAEFIAAYNELNRLKHDLTLHPSVMTQQNVAMLAFKYDEVKKELERVKTEQSKLLEWKDGIVRNSPTCPACAEQLFCGSTSVEHTCAVKENTDLKRDKARLQRCLRLFASVTKSGEPLTATYETAYSQAIDAAQAKEGA